MAVDIASLSKGDVIKIVDRWDGFIGQNSQGYMDKYLGKTLTVDEVLPIGFPRQRLCARI